MGFQGVGSFSVCLVIVAIATSASLFVIARFERSSKLGYVSRRDLRNPPWIIIFRGLACAYLFSILALDIRSHDIAVMMFYTQWSFALLAIYFLVAFAVSVRELVQSRRAYSLNRRFREEEMGDVSGSTTSTVVSDGNQTGFTGYLMQIIFQIVGGAAIVTDAVFWIVLYPGWSKEHTIDYLEAHVHGANLLIYLIEFFFNSMAFPWFRGAYLLLWSSIFVVVQWILHAAIHYQWVYPFLETSDKLAPLWYIGLFLVHIVLFAVLCGLTIIKRRLYARCLAQP